MNIFILNLFNDPEFFFGVALVVIFSICCHEFSHAWVAMKMGDSTAADHGHLTLNPIKQMGVISLFMFAIVGLAWGGVPVNRANFKSKYGALVTAMAGPLTNFLLFLIFAVALALVVYYDKADTMVFRWTLYAAVVNVVLGILNSLPIPGFDGWNFVATIFPKIERSNSEILRGTTFLMIMLLFIGIKYLFAIGSAVTGFVAQFAVDVLIRVGG